MRDQARLKGNNGIESTGFAHWLVVLVGDDGMSVPLEKLYPYPAVLEMTAATE